MLFRSQAISLSFTALPIWLICKKNNLSNNISWFSCGLWWLQPIVFNVNLFDFHPEVWAMPALTGCYLAAKNKNIGLWLVLSLFVIGCRDGLILVTAGIGLENLIRKQLKIAGNRGILKKKRPSFNYKNFRTYAERSIEKL